LSLRDFARCRTSCLPGSAPAVTLAKQDRLAQTPVIGWT
jgi:hypothetical protein